MTNLRPQCELKSDSTSSNTSSVVDNGGTPVIGTMELGGMLNGNRHAMSDAHMRQQFQHSMQMNHSVYGMGHPQMIPSHNPQHVMSPPGVMSYSMPALPQENMMSGYMPRHTPNGNHDGMDPHANRPKSEPQPKAFGCGTCIKTFARRSDLARHERIHSGIRPHACDHPGCGKQFIQRSALTVHARVHTGEKPHMCERCGKPFSDSSSLARHRRIHSGKRPYKCPFMNCQKTFTRRTTLTRHQNHHSGTLEQAQAETNALLSQSNGQPQSGPDSYSDGMSRQSETSPAATLSISPPQDVANMQNMQKSNSDFAYMAHQNQNHPSQMRNDFHPGTRSSQQQFGHSPVANYNNPAHLQNAMTSLPARFAPPQAPEGSVVNSVGASASQHVPNMTWQTNASAMQNNMHMEGYPFQEQQFNQMYYQDGNIRRPQSTEPQGGSFALPTRSMGHNMTPNGMHGMSGDWSTMPMSMHHDAKQERGYA